ncbi:hypothetical protein [Candidatus Finniella inopinata]|uniref:Uncharacterized protein n=1 Tax=Candidatus Finniella inopinata TaxID=1696036 RepID=A0A4Q7DHP0_9PROT|nr:hypothetical protein [Candidatus Finniella inopinata]RZI46273.1 hypothetical protein EQU50_04885 [Candidatus Finniella inopinata]
MKKLLFYFLSASHLFSCVELNASDGGVLNEKTSLSPTKRRASGLNGSPQKKMTGSHSRASSSSHASVDDEMDKENNYNHNDGQVVVWSTNGRVESDSRTDAVCVPSGAQVMRLEGPMNALHKEHFPRAFISQARKALKTQLTNAVQRKDTFEDPHAKALVQGVLERGDFNHKILQVIRDQVLDKGTFDEEYIKHKIDQTQALYPSKSPAAIKKAVVKDTVKIIIKPEELQNFLTAEVVNQIVDETVKETINDVENIRSVAEAKIQKAIEEKKFVTAKIEEIIKKEMIVATIDGSMKIITIDQKLLSDIQKLNQSLLESLLRAPTYNDLAQLMVQKGVVQDALQNFNDKLIIGHADPLLIYPGSERGIFYFLVPNMDEITQFRGVQLNLGGSQTNDQIKFTKFVGNFNVTMGGGSTTVIRFIQLRDYLKESVWDSIVTSQNLSALLQFYKRNQILFGNILRAVSLTETEEAKMKIYAESLTKKNVFSTILKPTYRTPQTVTDSNSETPVEDAKAHLENLNAVNASLFETLNVAYTIHIKCQIEKKKNPFITKILDEALIDSRDMIESMDYYFKDFNLPDPRLELTTDESMVIVRIKKKGRNTVSQAFGAWADRSLFAIPQAQPTLSSAPRKQLTGGSNCAIM